MTPPKLVGPPVPTDRRDGAVGTCDTCQQTRPVWRYRPTHDRDRGHEEDCYCRREPQPRLCVPCWSAERVTEEAVSDEEDEDR